MKKSRRLLVIEMSQHRIAHPLEIRTDYQKVKSLSKPACCDNRKVTPALILSRELFLNLALSFFEDFLFSVLELCDNNAE